MIISSNFTIYPDGTKIRYSEYDAEYPESIDFKITDYCDQNCSICHESSTKNGLHFDAGEAINLLSTLPVQTEVAIGGGNPGVLYEEINEMIEALPDIIFNVTLNSNHINYVGKIKANAFGISCTNNQFFITYPMEVPNIVIHLIAGHNTIDSAKFFVKHYPRILILGYKSMGRGVHNTPTVNLSDWRRRIGEIIQYASYHNPEVLISFDNLALKQLDISRFFTSEHFKRLYMGDDGKYSMYIDMVNHKYAKSSLSTKYDFINESIKDMFLNLKKNK